MTHPEHIKKLERMRKKADMLMETTKLHGREVYDSAAKKHLMNAEGYLDYERLEEDAVQENMGDDIAKGYMERAKKAFKSTASGKDEFENDLMLRAYADTSTHEIKELIRNTGKSFTYDVFHAKYI